MNKTMIKEKIGFPVSLNEAEIEEFGIGSGRDSH
jgi:hypothetical protein